jgi:hypothetical protein
MTNFILTALMVGAPMEDEKLVRTEVVILIGNGKLVEDPRNSVATSVLAMDDKGQFRSDGALLGRIDFEEDVSDSLKKCDFARYRIDLDFPETTPAPIVLDIIKQFQRAVKDGKRVELRIAYATKPMKE